VPRAELVRVRPFTLTRTAPPVWVIHAGLVAASLMIGVATAVSGDASTPYPLLYVCVVAFAFCLLNRAAALVHTMLVVAIYATTLSLFHGHNAEAALPRFAVFGVSLFAGAMLLDVLRLRHQRLTERIRDLMVGGGAGLLDRRGLEQMLSIEVERASRSGIRFAVITAAMDGEDMHSVHGTAAGRAAVIGQAVAQSVRSIDLAGRLSSNLFCILAIYTDERGAEAMVERIRASLAEAAAPGAVPSLSFGISIYGWHGISSEDLLEASRSALDAARKLGGARSIVAPSRPHDAADEDALRNPQVRVETRA